MLLLLLACTAEPAPCAEGYARDEDGNCVLDRGGSDTSDLTGSDTGTETSYSLIAEIHYYEELWPDVDEGWVSVHYHAYDDDDDVIGGRYLAQITNGVKVIDLDVEIIWADDRCPAGTHSAFECCTYYLNNVLTMYIAGVDQESPWTVTAYITDRAGNVSNTEVAVVQAGNEPG